MPISTPHTLLRLLRTREVGPDTWKTLVDHYGPAIAQWCTRRGLQPADAQDVTQTVLAEMFRRLHTFEYDPAIGFRPYLRRLIQSALADCVEQLRKFDPAGNREGDGGLADHPARAELEQVLRDRFDQEVLEEAMVRVAQQVAARTWEAFRLQAFGGKSAEDVAAALGMPIGSVYKAKSNVQKRLRAEVRALAGDGPAADPGPAD